VKRVIDFTPLDVSQVFGASEIVLIDYVFNLNNSEAAAAYDDLMGARLRFKQLQMSKTLTGMEHLTQLVYRDLEAVERIFDQDKHLKFDLRRIDRVFKGQNRAISDTKGVRLGLSLIRLQSTETNTHTKIMSYDRNNNTRYFLFDTFSPVNRFEFLWGWFRDDNIVSANLLMSADSNYVPNGFVALSLARELRLRRLNNSKYIRIRQRLKELLPSAINSKINLPKHDFSKEPRILNFYFRNEIFFRAEALTNVGSIPFEKLHSLLKEHLRTREKPSEPPQLGPIDPSGELTLNCYPHWIDCYEEDIYRIALNLSKVFDGRYSTQERYKAFSDTKNLAVFRAHGASFLLRLIPEDKLEESIYYDLAVEGKNLRPYKFSYGKFGQEDLYKSLLYIQSVLFNRSFDLRLHINEGGEFGPAGEGSIEL
ncbi:MAG: hypothetical protein N2578_01195, partial [Bdellovibrionaceae bacterium]|nr:hypothetical protein [Pseudobdellovibrionaceae bacterium]